MSGPDLAVKLQLRQRGLRVIRPPEGFRVDAPPGGDDDAVLVFVRDRADLDQHGAPALEAARADRLAWIAYPKGGQLGTDLNRDILWDLLRDQGVRPVRQISIDDTWSALRFRPA